MLVRWPHAHVPLWCAPGIVKDVAGVQRKTSCPVCGVTWDEPVACLDSAGAVPISWLKKIPRHASALAHQLDASRSEG
jgi:hypothetical protein